MVVEEWNVPRLKKASKLVKEATSVLLQRIQTAVNRKQFVEKEYQMQVSL